MFISIFSVLALFIVLLGSNNINAFAYVQNNNNTNVQQLQQEKEDDQDAAQVVNKTGSGFMYVTNFGDNTVSVINTTSNKVIKKGIPVGTLSIPLAFDSKHEAIYVGNSDVTFPTVDNKITVIDVATNKVVDTIKIPKNTGIKSAAEGIAFDSKHNRMYVALFNTSFPHTTIVIDTDADTVIKIIKGFSQPFSIAFDSKHNRMYVANTGPFVNVIGTTLNKVIKTISLSNTIGPTDIAFDSQHNRMYISDSHGSVVVLSTVTNKVIKTIPNVGLRPQSLAFDSKHKTMYVTNIGGSNVSVINTTSNKVIKTINVGKDPTDIAFDSQHNRMYVTDFDKDVVTVISTVTNKVIKTIHSVGKEPYRIAFAFLP
jgi:YVTN family beta-propeller protein